MVISKEKFVKLKVVYMLYKIRNLTVRSRDSSSAEKKYTILNEFCLNEFCDFAQLATVLKTSQLEINHVIQWSIKES